MLGDIVFCLLSVNLNKERPKMNECFYTKKRQTLDLLRAVSKILNRKYAHKKQRKLTALIPDRCVQVKQVKQVV